MHTIKIKVDVKFLASEAAAQETVSGERKIFLGNIIYVIMSQIGECCLSFNRG